LLGKKYLFYSCILFHYEILRLRKVSLIYVSGIELISLKKIKGNLNFAALFLYLFALLVKCFLN